MHQINFEVGDWSRDGHNQSESFVVESNKPVEELREAHFKAEKVLGFDIGDICGEYEQDKLTEQQGEMLVERGIIAADEYKYGNEYDGMSSNDIVSVWIRILMHVDPSLDLKIVTEERLPSMHFYGVDEKKRHLNVPGYGTFY